MSLGSSTINSLISGVTNSATNRQTRGTRASRTGLPTMLADPRHAATNYNITNTYLHGIPKPKYLFYVRFVSPLTSGRSNVVFQLLSMDRPTLNLDTETLNQYNKPRIIHTKVEKQPIRMTLYDTNDGASMRLFLEYYNYFYYDNLKTSAADFYPDIVTNDFSPNWGVNASKTNSTANYFFSHIEVYQFSGNLYDRFDIIHPKITVYDPDTLDYSAGSEPSVFELNVAYEGILYRANGENVTKDMVGEFKFDIGQPFHPLDNNIPPPSSGGSPAEKFKTLNSGVENILNSGITNNLTNSSNPIESFGKNIQWNDELQNNNSQSLGSRGTFNFGVREQDLGPSYSTTNSFGFGNFSNNTALTSSLTNSIVGAISGRGSGSLYDVARTVARASGIQNNNPLLGTLTNIGIDKLRNKNGGLSNSYYTEMLTYSALNQLQSGVQYGRKLNTQEYYDYNNAYMTREKTISQDNGLISGLVDDFTSSGNNLLDNARAP